jgi:uncharacterized SAM-binding protein YcdF (DUF218 family)
METALFILAKVVGAGLRVESWLVLLAILSLLAHLRGRSGVALRLTGLLTTLLIALTALPIGSLALRPIEATFAPDPALTEVEGIIVLGGSEDVATSRFWGTVELRGSAERLTAAAALARRFPAARILLVGGGGRLRDLGGIALSEAQVASRFLEEQGISRARLVLEEQSRNTTENARLALTRAEPGDGQVWVLVTSAYHMPRAMQSFEAAGWTGLVPYPVDHRSGRFVDGIGWALAENIELLNIAVREWVGRTANRVMGR